MIMDEDQWTSVNIPQNLPQNLPLAISGLEQEHQVISSTDAS